MNLHPPVRLSDHVVNRETQRFQDFCAGMLRQTKHPLLIPMVESYRLEVQEASKAAIGPGARVQVDGSMAKQTQWRLSDLDIVVDTDEPVTRSQRERLVEALKGSRLLHPRHVVLGKRSIHVKVSRRSLC